MPTTINFASSILTECTYSSGLLFAYKIDYRKARGRELATFDGNQSAVGMLNNAENKLMARAGREKERHL